jgi:hypothetical protein
VVQQMLGHSSLAKTQIYLGRANLDQLWPAMDGRIHTSRHRRHGVDARERGVIDAFPARARQSPD